MKIQNLLDPGKLLVYQAKQTFEIRNDLRAGPREVMVDQKAADYLRNKRTQLDLRQVDYHGKLGSDKWLLK